MIKYKINDGVQWTYQRRGMYGPGTGDSVTLRGIIVEIVQPGALPTERWAAFSGADNHNKRLEESYVVKDLSGRIFRPHIRHLDHI